MKTIQEVISKDTRLAIGLMSGTCTDGIDAALIKIHGSHINSKVDLLGFITVPYSEEVRNRLLEISSGNLHGSSEICKMNVLLGHLSLTACLEVCNSNGIPTESIDFIASHGHTIYHQPVIESYLGYPISSTLQIGEPSIIREVFHCPIISDFRVRDMSAHGNGAPLVPYTEYLLYSQKNSTVALQNIGGIGNITYLSDSNLMEDVIAFDTGPGNMVIDALVSIHTNNQLHYDKDGHFASTANVDPLLLSYMLEDPYPYLPYPKTTGREYYGSEFVTALLNKSNELQVSLLDTIATATMFTAKTIAISVTNLLPKIPSTLILGGGGSYNPTLVRFIKDSIPDCKIVSNEEIGHNSSAKEAIAFAILGNETLHSNCNNVPSATGATHGVIMGKITL